LSINAVDWTNGSDQGGGKLFRIRQGTRPRHGDGINYNMWAKASTAGVGFGAPISVEANARTNASDVSLARRAAMQHALPPGLSTGSRFDSCSLATTSE